MGEFCCIVKYWKILVAGETTSNAQTKTEPGTMSSIYYFGADNQLLNCTPNTASKCSGQTLQQLSTSMQDVRFWGIFCVSSKLHCLWSFLYFVFLSAATAGRRCTSPFSVCIDSITFVSWAGKLHFVLHTTNSTDKWKYSVSFLKYYILYLLC